MGDDGDQKEDSYKIAIRYFDKALKASDSGKGSKILTGREVSRALYSRGRAYTRLFESTTHRSAKKTYLSSAYRDFRESRDRDKDQDKAAIALDKMADRLRPTAYTRIINRTTPILVGSVSAAILILTQLSFILGIPRHLDLSGANYITVTFGSLIFLAASAYLPHVNHLKFAGFEIEKKPVDQIGTVVTLDIAR